MQDMEHALRRSEPFGSTRRRYKKLEDELFNLEQWARLAHSRLQDSSLPRGEDWFVKMVVESLSELFLDYMPDKALGLNRRYPENSPYMQFVRQSAAPIIGRKHSCADQMAAFCKSYKASNGDEKL